MTLTVCPTCSKPISADDWGHPVCPRCLLGDAMKGEDETHRLPEPPVEAGSWPTGPLKQVGPYRIVRAIASGGMGTVFEAAQERPRRTVAVKVMRQGIASPSAMRRFEYEAQLLGALRHPGIAQIFEAGTYDDGGVTVPFFAMEYIPDAKPLTQYAEDQHLGVRERLELFAMVCDAVHHGHQKGVIHRDLKPGNILVDAAGFAKVIDFGVARSTDSDVAATTMHTDVGQLVGTLQYMSPEQVLADPADLDMRSDVYSLGVVLYELLCRRSPYDLRRLPLLEATRHIRESAPDRPSTVSAVLRGDVETIALKALEKERDQRYQSAHELATDIRRYLRGEPILAQPASVAYQVRVFVRRNKTLVAAVAAIFVVLVGAVIVSASLYLRAEAAREIAASERDSAEAVTNYLRSTLAAADPGQSRGKDVTVREMLDRSAAEIGTSFQGKPSIEAAVRETLGSTYLALGAIDQAEPHLTASLATRRSVFGPKHELTLESELAVADLRFTQGNYVDAERIVRSVLDDRRRILGLEHPDTLSTLAFLGQILRDYGKNEEAESVFGEMLELQRRVLGPEHRRTLASQYTLATLIEKRGGYSEAERLHRMTLDARLKTLGEDHPSSIWSMTLLAFLYNHAGRYDEAEPLIRRALDVANRVLGATHVDTQWTKNVWGEVLLDSGRPQESIPVFREILALRRRALGEDHRDTLWATTNLSLALGAIGQTAEAEILARAALESRERRLGPEHADTIWSRGVLGRVLLRGNKFGEAETLLRRNVTALQQRHARHGQSLQLLGEALIRQGKFEEAEQALLDLDSEAAKNPEAPPQFTRRTVELFVELYRAWDAHDASGSHASQLARWRERLQLQR